MESEAIFIMLATPGRKQIPEQTDGAEATVSDANRTDQKRPKNKPTCPNSAESEDDEEYPPTPNTRKSHPDETASEKEQEEEAEDIEKAYRDWHLEWEMEGDEPRTDLSEEEAAGETKIRS